MARRLWGFSKGGGVILSFGWTANRLPPKGRKNETRRKWKPRQFEMWCKAWDTRPDAIHKAFDKCPAYGGKQIGVFPLTDRPFLQEFQDMTPADVANEGHPEMLDDPDPVESFLKYYFWRPKKTWSQYQIEDEWEALLLTEVAVVRFEFEPVIPATQLSLF